MHRLHKYFHYCSPNIQLETNDSHNHFNYITYNTTRILRQHTTLKFNYVKSIKIKHFKFDGLTRRFCNFFINILEKKVLNSFNLRFGKISLYSHLNT